MSDKVATIKYDFVDGYLRKSHLKVGLDWESCSGDSVAQKYEYIGQYIFNLGDMLSNQTMVSDGYVITSPEIYATISALGTMRLVAEDREKVKDVENAVKFIGKFDDRWLIYLNHKLPRELSLIGVGDAVKLPVSPLNWMSLEIMNWY